MASEDIGAGDPDVVFVTIDCWRHDALQWMPTLREHVDERGYEQAETICAAPSTRGAFGAIFGGNHYPSSPVPVRTSVQPKASERDGRR